MNDQEPFILAQAAPASGSTGISAPIPSSPTSATTEASGSPAIAANDVPPGASPLTGMLLPLGLFVLLYFVMIRPQTKKEKERQKQIKALGKNDKVLTRGGIYGIVSGIKAEEGIASIKISDNVKVDISLQAIESVNPKKGTEK